MVRDVAVILLYDDKKRILLQYRGENMERLPNHWAFFGGGIDEGETPEEAVKREAMEELEYSLENPRQVFVQDFKGVHNSGKKYVFIEKYNPQKKLVLHEGENLGWKSFSDTKDLKIADHDREVIIFFNETIAPKL